MVDPDLPGYAERVLPWLERDPVENNVLCTLLLLRLDGSIPQPETSVLAWLDGGDGQPAGAAVCTPPFQLVLPALPPDAVAPLADLLAGAGAGIPGVAGPVPSADLFARAWTARTAARAEVLMHQRLYRLDRLTPPPAVPGRLRPARKADLAFLVGWTTAFAAEAGLPQPVDPEAAVARRIARGGLHLWTVDGAPRCMVGTAPPARHVVRIGPVYTPPEHRRHGYGSAATAAVSRSLLDDGAAACILYTDQGNPTSNGIYQRIGFRPLSDHREWLFVRR